MKWTRYLLELALANGADLRGAALCGADLRGADLRGANSIICLSFSHSWNLILVRFPDGPRIHCGCQWFTVSEAKAHWKRHEGSQRRAIVLPALKSLLILARVQGWEMEQT